DMNDFTKSILPRMFKHSNFASFVRQLNKYDWHKVKNTDGTQFGEHSWTFRHPDFHADRREALENMKRKVPAARVSAPSRSAIGPSTLGRSGSAGPLGGELKSSQTQTNTLASHTSALQNQHSALQVTTASRGAAVSERLSKDTVGRSEDRVRGLERYYKDVLGEMVRFQRNLAQQDGLMQSLVQYFLRAEGGESAYFFWSGSCSVR
ncbi:HSF-type DNA-binding-domain-containing protein, partial [Pisolithus tinctorius]